MTIDTFTFTIRRQLLGDLLTRMEKLNCQQIVFGFTHLMTDPWPADPVRVWSLAVYTDDGDEAPCFIESIPIVRAVGGTEYERVGIVPYRYGALCALQALWERVNPSVTLLDLVIRVRDDVWNNTLESIRMEPSAMGEINAT